jgi:hypothetical protein
MVGPAWTPPRQKFCRERIALFAGVFVFFWRTMTMTVAIVLVSLPIAMGVAASIVAVLRRG